MNSVRWRPPQIRTIEVLQVVEDEFLNLFPPSKERYREDVRTSNDVTITPYTSNYISEDADYPSEEDVSTNNPLVDYTLAIENLFDSDLVRSLDNKLMNRFPSASSASIYHLWPLSFVHIKQSFNFQEIVSFLQKLSSEELNALMFSWQVYPKKFTNDFSSYIVNYCQISDVLSAIDYLLRKDDNE